MTKSGVRAGKGSKTFSAAALEDYNTGPGLPTPCVIHSFYRVISTFENIHHSYVLEKFRGGVINS